MDINSVRFEQAKEKVIGIARERHGIGTLAEKTVHAVMKHYYEPDEDKQEIPIENYVADIYTGEGIIEIQTRQLNAMRNKLSTFLPDYQVTIVHPIPRQKWLIWIDEETGELSPKRKSPLKGTPYHAFKELYKIKMYLKDKNLKIHLPLIDIEEYRRLNGWSKDKKKGSTRYDRIPLQITEIVTIECLQDYMQFVPYDLPDQFTVKEFAKAAHIQVRIAQTVVHILNHVGVIRKIGKDGRSHLYEIIE